MSFENVLTVCPYCGTGCQLYLEVFDGALVGVSPCKTDQVSQGKLCIKGWNAHEFVANEKRLLSPLVKKNGELKEATWEEALGLVAEKLKEVKKNNGPDAIAVLSSAKCTNEENYLLQKFTRAVIGTNNIDHCARLCHASTVAGLAKAFGSGAMTNSTPEFEDCGCIFIIGSNTVEQHPLIASRIVKAEENGAKLIVADPREISLTLLADIHLKHKPGTDVALLNSMMATILKEGLEDKKFIKERTEGFAELKATVEKYPPEETEQITGVPSEALIEAARTYAKAEKASIVYSMGITQHTTGVDQVLSIANLAMLCGNIGLPSTGVNPLRGQNNVQGACDMGALPNVFSGYQSVTDVSLREKFEKAWNTPLPDKIGLTLVEMTNAAAKGDIKMMYIMGENPMLSDPDINHVKEALEKLDFLVVQDIFLTETAELADVVLPGTSYAEKDGTFTATDRRVQLIRKVIEPLGDSKPDWMIICELAKKMGAQGFEYNSPSEIMNEIASLTPIYGGIQHPRLDEVGYLAWPCPSSDHPGTPYLHKDKFTRGKGKFTAVEFKGPAELPDKDYPFILTTGRIMFHWHTGTMTRKTPQLDKEVPTGYVEINSKDAERLGIKNGESIKVKTRRGEIQIPALVTKKILEGVMFIPFHFAECPANMLTNAALDPVAKIPELKVCAANVEKTEVEKKDSYW
ncbi:MAG: formate dehydrogenase subunit alpha [Candidatus Bathyarchaeota archaeon]